MYQEIIIVFMSIGWCVALTSIVINLYLLRQYRILYEIHKEERFYRNLGEFEYSKRRDIPKNNNNIFTDHWHPQWNVLSQYDKAYRIIRFYCVRTINWILGRVKYDARHETFEWVRR